MTTTEDTRYSTPSRWGQCTDLGPVLLAILWPSVAHADDMSGLLYLVIVWPLAALFGAILIGLMLFAALVPLKREPSQRYTRLATGMVTASIVLDLIFILVTLGCEAYFNHFDTVGPTLIHVAVFQLLVIPSVALGMRVRRRSPMERPR